MAQEIKDSMKLYPKTKDPVILKKLQKLELLLLKMHEAEDYVELVRLRAEFKKAQQDLVGGVV